MPDFRLLELYAFCSYWWQATRVAPWAWNTTGHHSLVFVWRYVKISILPFLQPSPSTPFQPILCLSYSPSFRNLRFCWQRFDRLQKLSYFNKDFWFKHLLFELEFRMKQSILCMLDLSVICTWKGKWYLRVRSCYFEALPFYNIIVSLLAKVRETYKKS